MITKGLLTKKEKLLANIESVIQFRLLQFDSFFIDNFPEQKFFSHLHLSTTVLCQRKVSKTSNPYCFVKVLVVCCIFVGIYHEFHQLWIIRKPLEISGNLWISPETGRSGFQQVSAFFHKQIFFEKRSIEKNRKPAGNRSGRFPEVSSRFSG